MRKALSKLNVELIPVEETCSKVEQGLEESAKFGTDVDAGEKELHRLQVWFMAALMFCIISLLNVNYSISYD